MARLGCFVGVILIVFAFVSMCVLIVLPVLPFGENNPTLMSVQAALVCKPGEQFTMVGSNFSDSHGSGRSFQSYCVDAEGTRRNVLGASIGIAMVAFLGPFLIGLFLVIAMSSLIAKRRLNRLVTNAGVTLDGSSTGYQPFDGSAGSTMQVGGYTVSNWSNGGQTSISSGGGKLADKLQQLSDAREKGLISQTEYEQLRQKILDEAT